MNPPQETECDLNLISSFLMDTNASDTHYKSQMKYHEIEPQNTEFDCESQSQLKSETDFISYSLDESNNNNAYELKEDEIKEEYEEEQSVLTQSSDSSSSSSNHIEGEINNNIEIEIETNNNNNTKSHDDLLILLDWDDTLFPTTIINDVLSNRDNNDFALIRDDQIELLIKLGNITYQLLNELVYKYNNESIIIVTNSLSGWIIESLSYASCISKIYKQIELLLIENNITMISAQSMYKEKCGNNSTPTVWKQLCFEDIFKNINKKYKHILSIGDQWTDHQSVKQSINNYYQSVTQPIHHVIKLKMNPNLNDMINEILYIQTCFYQIFDIISLKTNTFFNNTQSISPVIIDYYQEEIKYYQKQSSININLNVNLNLNVNVVNTNQ